MNFGKELQPTNNIAFQKTMLSVADAFIIIQQHQLSLPAEAVSLAQAPGRVLRGAVRADRDFPPFDRVAMDGIAIAFADFQAGQSAFRIVGTQRAGQPQQLLSEAGTCLEVMTGAMLPIGADTVVRYEDVLIADGVATVTITDVERGLNVHHRAVDRRAGDELLPAGTWLNPAALAVAASVGQPTLSVSALPRVAIVSTGDELVDVDEIPLPYQIRRSNSYMLRAALAALGIQASLNHIPDNQDQLEADLRHLLTQNDLLILSGGVSAGKADFVPDVLTRLGVQKRFHQIAQRPGKPIWFGASAEGKIVFGLPGNPVSTALCAYRYVMPFLRTSLGLPLAAARYAQLAEPVTFKPALTYFLPVRLTTEPDGRTLAHPLPGSGSADFANLIEANQFIELPADRSEFSAGEAFQLWGA